MRQADKKSQYNIEQMQLSVAPKLPSSTVPTSSVHCFDEKEEVPESTSQIIDEEDKKQDEAKEKIKKWLTEINLSEYYDNFIESGFKSMKIIREE